MIQIELKAKHYYLIANLLFREQAVDSFSLLGRIKESTTGVQDDDLITVESSVQEFLSAYQTLSIQPEGQYASPNAEMMSLLTPQIQAGVAANDPEWIDVAVRIQAMRDTNDAVIVNYIAYAKSRLS